MHRAPRRPWWQALCTDLAWLGLEWDEGPDRPGRMGRTANRSATAIYQQYFERLERERLAYPCFCSSLELDLSRRAQLAAGRPPRYAGTCRELTAERARSAPGAGRRPSLRFRVPAGQRIEFQDLVHGAQSFCPMTSAISSSGARTAAPRFSSAMRSMMRSCRSATCCAARII
jgi:nondiscriminating glutamyl-tRNA synthetase